MATQACFKGRRRFFFVAEFGTSWDCFSSLGMCSTSPLRQVTQPFQPPVLVGEVGTGRLVTSKFAGGHFSEFWKLNFTFSKAQIGHDITGVPSIFKKTHIFLNLRISTST